MIEQVFNERFRPEREKKSAMRRKIGLPELENIALGAAVLGTGGGGDPYVGKLMAAQAIREHGPVPRLHRAPVFRMACHPPS